MHEVPEDSAVMAVFTTGVYTRGDGTKALSFNIVSVVLLENPATDEFDMPTEIEKPIGVREQVTAVVVEEDVMASDDDDSEVFI